MSSKGGGEELNSVKSDSIGRRGGEKTFVNSTSNVVDKARKIGSPGKFQEREKKNTQNVGRATIRVGPKKKKKKGVVKKIEHRVGVKPEGNPPTCATVAGSLQG